MLGLPLAIAGVAAAGACLPDLAAIPGGGASLEGGAAPFRGCGDGIIATLDDGGDAGESCDPGEPDADVPGCRTCTIVCEGALDPRSGHCYFAAGEDATYTGARTRCRSARAHVVTLASDEEVAVVRTVATDDDAGYWLGLSRDPTLVAYTADRPEEPGFPSAPATAGASVPSCEGCFGIGADAGVFPIADVDAADTPCIASRGGTWFQVACSGASRPTICEREPVGTRAQDCIGGFCFTLPRTAGDKTYLVAVSATDPETAAQSCAGLDGGSLVVLGTREEREQLAHEIAARYPDLVDQQLWIGLVEDGGAWTWEDGVAAAQGASRPLPWGNAQPDGGPGARAYMRLVSTAYDTQLAYADDGARTPRLYICQRAAR